MGETANGRNGEGRAKNSARPACGSWQTHFAPVLSRFFEMASSNLTGHPRSIRINYRNRARKQTQLKTGAVRLRVKSHHWRAEFFALPTVLAASPIAPFALSPFLPLAYSPIRPLAPPAS
jgi:hypothetical protein